MQQLTGSDSNDPAKTGTGGSRDTFAKVEPMDLQA